MLFGSILFLWIFLPVVLAGNYILTVIPFHSAQRRIRFKNGFLLAASLVFYAWGGVYYLFLILSVILLNYLAGRLIDTSRTHRKHVFVCAVLANLLLLFYFKYFNLAVATIEQIGHMERGALGIREVVLPVGISFYIFQAMSYVIDLYRGKTGVQKSLPRFALYVSLFPQLIAGPIVLYKDVQKQLEDRTETAQMFLSGISRFVTGLAKKVLIADSMAQVADNVFALETDLFGAPVAWWGMFAYTMQIYFDFSGYSDMAIGLGRMLGFSFKENFNLPYTAESVRTFWRRWHISLSAWFRDYVYIPLGGSKGSERKTDRNLLVTFFLTGIWHGANYTFFAWGIYHALWIIAERLTEGKIKRIPVIGRVYTMIAVMIGWVLFRSDTISYALHYIARLIAFDTCAYSVFNFLSMRILLAAVCAVAFACFGKPEAGQDSQRTGLPSVPVFAAQMVLFALSVLLIVSGSYSPFIYYRF